jgi:Trypsin
MNNKFDELTKSLAHSVTRRGALKTLGLGLAGIALTRVGLQRAEAITLGQPDGDAHPNVGGLVWLKSAWPPTPAPLVCGSGTLIHPRVFLTAGHGTDLIEGLMAQGTMTLDDLRVSFASDASDPGTWRAVSGILTHPGYAPQATSAEDVGVLILRKRITGIPPVPLPPLGFLDALAAAGELKAESDRTRFTVVGYGIDPGDANSGHLPFPPDGLRRFAHPEFQNLHDRWLYTDQNDSHDNGGSCPCDSGGPLFWADPVTGEETLVAVVSRGSLSSAHDYRVDTEEALTFLNQVIARVEAGEL